MSLLDEAQRYPVPTVLCVGALAAMLAKETGRSIDHLVLIDAHNAMREPWRIVTTIFPHGGLIHLVLNLLWTWQLGRAIEARMGTGATIILALVTAVAASSSQLILGGRPVGLSGVVYGFAGYAWMRGRRDPRFRDVIDDSTRNLLITWFFVCILLTQTNVLHVANAAHAGGALMGVALGSARPWLSPLIVTLIGTGVLFRVTTTYPRPDAAALRAFDAGVVAFNQGDMKRAATLFADATDREPDFPEAWFNLGLARSRRGESGAAAEAYLEVARLAPKMFKDPKKRAFYLDLLQTRRNERNGSGD